MHAPPPEVFTKDHTSENFLSACRIANMEPTNESRMGSVLPDTDQTKISLRAEQKRGFQYVGDWL